MSLLLTIGLNEWCRLPLAFLLLFATIDPIVNTNSYSDIFVERLRTVFLVDLVFNLFFKAVVE
jgi:hypothetical protein